LRAREGLTYRLENLIKEKIMGSGFGIDCEDCNYSWEFNVGSGMMWNPTLDNLKSNFLSFDQAMDLDFQLLGRLPDTVDFYAGIFYCKKCLFIQGRFHYHLEVQQGENIISAHKCSRCRRELTQIKDPDTDELEIEELRKMSSELNLKCKKCKSHNISFGEGLLWD
jgi:hypothetical protein